MLVVEHLSTAHAAVAEAVLMYADNNIRIAACYNLTSFFHIGNLFIAVALSVKSVVRRSREHHLYPLLLQFSLWMLMRHMLYSGEKEVAAGTAVNIVTEESKQTESDEGYLVVIDPGHGGVDPGMLGVNDTVEKEINLAIAYRLKEKLEEQGIKVVLTRTYCPIVSLQLMAISSSSTLS